MVIFTVSNTYIEFESNGERKKTLSIKDTSKNLNHIYLRTIAPDVLYSKKEDILYLRFKAELKLSKTSHSLDHFKQRCIALFCG